eukprot:scaffold33013_cov39-Phaeocystis_antarctica.AAC.1
MWTVNKKRHSGGCATPLECGVALARTLPEMPNSVRFAFPGPLVDRLYERCLECPNVNSESQR